MSFSYEIRALILAFGAYLVFHAAVAACLSAWRLLRLESLAPRTAAAILFGLRMLPMLLALALTAGYLRWEREPGPESVAMGALIAALAAATIWTHSLIRAARALWTARCPAGVIESDELFVGVAGLLHHRILVTRGFLDHIQGPSQEVAMRHEMAHFEAGDNWKRLLMLATPSLGFDAIENAWARYAERAADDRAVAGDPNQALLLAEVLIQTARANKWRNQPLTSSLVGSACDIQSRVERLLACQPPPQTPRTAVAIMAATLVLTITAPSEPLFRLLERLLMHASR